MSQVFRVANTAELVTALSNAKGGDTIQMAGGTYDDPSLRNMHFDSEVTLISEDADDPAIFTRLKMNNATNVTIDGVVFDYQFNPDLERPFDIINGTDITIRNSQFIGDEPVDYSPEADGFGYGIALSMRDSHNITVENNDFTTFKRGIVSREIDGLKIIGNEITDMRSDGMNFASVKNVLVEDNYLHNFRTSPTSKDHPDFIQFWTNGTDSPSEHVVITGNHLNIGDGDRSHGIFMRNEEVDNGRAGIEMYYVDIEITQNTIVAGHVHGIVVPEADGVVIANNIVVHADGRNVDGLDPMVEIPRIRVNENAKNVTIESNITYTITGYTGQADWNVTNNAMVQDQNAFATNYYNDVFVTSTLDEGGAEYLIRPGSALDVANVGTTQVQPENASNSIAYFNATSLSDTPGHMRFDVANPNGSEPEGTVYLWTMEDGTKLQGASITHQFSTAGKHNVTLEVLHPDGFRKNAEAVIKVQDSTIVKMGENGGFTAYDYGVPLALSNDVSAAERMVSTAGTGKGLDLGAQGVTAEIGNEHVHEIFAKSNFSIDFNLQADNSDATGEVFRIHASMVVRVLESGSLEVSANSGSGSKVKLESTTLNLQDLGSHDISLKLVDNDLQLWVNGAMDSSTALTGGLAESSQALSFGNAWGKTNFDGTLNDFSITIGSGNTVKTPSSQPAPTPSPAQDAGPEASQKVEQQPEPAQEPEPAQTPDTLKKDATSPADRQPEPQPQPAPKAANGHEKNGLQVTLQNDGSLLAESDGSMHRVNTGDKGGTDGLSLGNQGPVASVDGQVINSLLDNDAFEISMTLQADAGRPNITGEVIRLDGSFIVQVIYTGEIIVRAFGEDVSINRMMTEGANLLDSKPHDVTLRYTDKDFQIVVDGAVVGQMEMSGAMASKSGADLQFGNPWGGRNFKGDIKEFSLSNTVSDNKDTGQDINVQAAMSYVEIAQDLSWLDDADVEDVLLGDVDSFDFTNVTALDVPMPSYSTDALFEG